MIYVLLGSLNFVGGVVIEINFVNYVFFRFWLILFYWFLVFFILVGYWWYGVRVRVLVLFSEIGLF